MGEVTAGSAVVVFPGVGGSAGMFADLRRHLPSTVDFVVPDTPGRGRRTRSTVDRVDVLAGELSAELNVRVAGRPYVVFAACFGTVIAFEVLRAHRRHAVPLPVRLVVCGRPAPDTAGGLGEYVSWSTEQMAAFLRRSLPADHDWDTMPDELRQVLLSRLRKDIAVGAGYAYADGDPFDVPIVAYHGLSDTETTRSDLESWRRHTTAGLTVRSVPGNSYFYLTGAEAVVPDLTLAATP